MQGLLANFLNPEIKDKMLGFETAHVIISTDSRSTLGNMFLASKGPWAYLAFKHALKTGTPQSVCYFNRKIASHIPLTTYERRWINKYSRLDPKIISALQTGMMWPEQQHKVSKQRSCNQQRIQPQNHIPQHRGAHRWQHLTATGPNKPPGHDGRPHQGASHNSRRS